MIIRLSYNNVVLLGFEPRLADPETAVLPLHHRTIFYVPVLRRESRFSLIVERFRVDKNTKIFYQCNTFTKNRKSIELLIGNSTDKPCLVVSRRFELLQAEPKTAVLPLHHETILGLIFQKRCKDTIVFLFGKIF